MPRQGRERQSDPLSAFIRARRRKLRMSQTDLAIRIGVSQPTVAHWEHGLHTPTVHHLRALADVLGEHELLRELLEDAEAPLAQTNLVAAPRYLERPIQHVPILAWPKRAERFEPAVAPREDHVAASMHARRPFALVVRDPAMARVFPPGCVVVFEGADTALSDGCYHLVQHEGHALVRRWRTEPDRLEAASEGFDTVFPNTPPRSFGRALVFYQVLDEAIRSPG